MPVLSKIRPVKGWDFAKRRRFPVRCPRVTVIFRRTTLKRETIHLFAPRLILGVSDELSQRGEIDRIEAISELVDRRCGLAD